MYVVAERRIITGDATTDGEAVVDDLEYQVRFEKMSAIAGKLGLTPQNCEGCDLSSEDLDGDGSITAADVIKARDEWDPAIPTAPTHASTNIDIHGDPNDRVKVTAGSAGQTIAIIVGLDANDELLLDGTGKGSITAVSTGQTVDYASLDLLFERVNGAGGPDDIDNLRIKVVPQQDYGIFYNTFAGAVWGGGEGKAAFAADAVVSFLLIGDIRDILVQTLFAADPDELTIAFAGIGLATQFTGLGDVAITWLKRVAKKLNQYRRVFGAKFGRPIVRIIRDVLAGRRSFQEVEGFFKALLDHRFLHVAMTGGERGINQMIRVLDRLGDSWAGYIARAGTDVSIGAAKKVARGMSAIDDATVNLIRGWPAARQERLAQGIARCWGKLDGDVFEGVVDDRLLTDLLTRDRINAVETLQRQFPDLNVGFDGMLEQLGKVAANGTEGTREYVTNVLRPALINYAQRPVDGNFRNLKGHLNELQRMADIVDGRFADSLGDTRYALEGMGRYPRPTEGSPNINADAWGKHLDTNQPVIWEMKHGRSPTGEQRKDLLDEIDARVKVSEIPGHPMSGAKIIVELRGDPWSPKLRQDLLQKGTNVEVVP